MSEIQELKDKIASLEAKLYPPAKVPGYCEECLTPYDFAEVPPASPSPCCHATLKWGKPKRE